MVDRQRRGACNDNGGTGIGAGHVCRCIRPEGHPLDSPRPHGCGCGALWASRAASEGSDGIPVTPSGRPERPGGAEGVEHPLRAAVRLRPHYPPCDHPDSPCSCGAAEDRRRIVAYLERSGSQGVGYRPLEGSEQAAHTKTLARVLEETWRAGGPIQPGGRIDWLRFAHGIEERLLDDPLEDEPSPAAPFAQVTTPVDTVHELHGTQCACGAKAPLGESITRWFDRHLAQFGARPKPAITITVQPHSWATCGGRCLEHG